MPVPLVRRNLLHSLPRLAGALLGVGLAVALVFTQLGFLNAMLDSTVRIVDRFDGDVLLLSANRQSLVTPAKFPRVRLRQAETVPGVREARPLSVLGSLPWRLPASGTATPSQSTRVTLMIVDPLRPALKPPEKPPQPQPTTTSERTTPERTTPERTTPERTTLGPAWTTPIRLPDTVLFDSLASAKVARTPLGGSGELAGRRITVAGRRAIGGNLFTGGYFVTSEQTAGRLLGPLGDGGLLPTVDFGVVQLEDGADVEAVVASLRQTLPGDVVVLPRESPWWAPWPLEGLRGWLADEVPGDSYARRERWFWLTNTPVGFVFLLGVAVGMLVAAVIMYQILQADISRHLSEYATLKAMGYDNRFLGRIVRTEALWLAAGGFVPGVAIAAGLYTWLEQLTGLPLDFTPGRLAVVFALTVLSCLLAARLAVGKLFKASPADLF